ncbi:MAG: hypothetical protein RL701_2936, partial [Pseudomonadota bacterium]
MPNSSATFSPDLERAFVAADVEALRKDYIEKLLCERGRFLAVATQNDHY